MNLDRRAAQAARSLRASVSGVAPVGIPTIVGRQRRSLITSFAVAAAAVVFIVGAAAAMPRLFEPDQVATNPTVPDGTPVVVEPDDKEGDGTLVIENRKQALRVERQKLGQPMLPAILAKVHWHLFVGEPL